MPQVIRQSPKRHVLHLTRRIYFMVLLVATVAVAVPVAFFLNPHTARADVLLSPEGPNPADYIYNGNTQANEYFVISNDGYVQVPTTSVRLYFAQRTGNTVTIESPGTPEADRNRNIDSYNTANSGVVDNLCQKIGNEKITNFNISSSMNSSVTTYQSTCAETAPHVFNINPNDLTAVPNAQTGYYQLTLTATILNNAPLQNNFRIILATAGNTTGKPPVVGYAGNQAAQNLGLDEAYTPAESHYTDYDIKFGSDCSVVTENTTPARIAWYDADNGSFDVQRKTTSFHLIASNRTGATNPTDVTFTSLVANDGSQWTNAAHTEITPGGASNMSGYATFIPDPTKKYDWAWDGKGTGGFGVFDNNTLQVGIPFDGIFYNVACQVQKDYSLSALLNGPNPATTVLTAGETSQQVTTGDFSAQAKNTTAITSGTYTLSVSKVAPPAGVTNDGPAVTFTGPAGHVEAGSVVWRNQQPIVGNSTTLPNGFAFTVGAGATSGGQVCFQSKITPSDLEGDSSLSAINCYVITNTYYPGLVAQGSDVNAGGGITSATGSCSVANTSYHTDNSISGFSSTYGQYAVSAVGPIFAAVGSDQKANDATLGATGHYDQICHTDLAATMADYVQNPAHTNVYHVPDVGGAGVTLNQLVNEADAALGLDRTKPIVLVYSGAKLLLLGGTVDQTVTLYLPNAYPPATSFNIQGNITLANTTATAANQPSLGIVATGYINIAGNVSEVDAFMYADDNIHSCAYFACNTTLTVKGFLMAHGQLVLKRTGTSANPIGEMITMAPQLYTNPPIGFGGSLIAGSGGLKDMGEKNPLY